MGDRGAHPPGAGKSSFELVDAKKAFDGVECGGKTVLDLGCGEGNYTLLLADKAGPTGTVYGVDAWAEGIAVLRTRAAARGFRNVETFVSDAGKLTLPDDSVDLCFMATVFHDIVQEGKAEQALREMKRVMRDGATLLIVEFKKIDGPPGPPKEIRMAPGEVERAMSPQGFRRLDEGETGPYTYRMLFRLVKNAE